MPVTQYVKEKILVPCRTTRQTANRLTFAPSEVLYYSELSLLKDTTTAKRTQLFSYVGQHKIQNILCLKCGYIYSHS